MDNIDVSIIIPVKNGIGGGIENCLDGIFSQKTKKTVEVIVIDSGSTDGTMDILKRYKKITLINILPEEFGHGKTRNLGASLSSGKYLVFMNADAWPKNGNWLDAMIDGFSEDDTIVAVYGRQIPKDACYSYVCRDMENSLGDQKQVISCETRKRDIAFSTVSAAIKRVTWASFPFDDSIDIAEDKEWAEKVLQNGYKIIYEPSSIIYHSHNYSFRQMFDVKLRAEKSLKHIFHEKKRPFLSLLMSFGGFLYKFVLDIFYILKQRMGIMKKLSEIKISLFARAASFSGKYFGGLS